MIYSISIWCICLMEFVAIKGGVCSCLVLWYFGYVWLLFTHVVDIPRLGHNCLNACHIFHAKLIWLYMYIYHVWRWIGLSWWLVMVLMLLLQFVIEWHFARFSENHHKGEVRYHRGTTSIMVKNAKKMVCNPPIIKMWNWNLKFQHIHKSCFFMKHDITCYIACCIDWWKIAGIIFVKWPNYHNIYLRLSIS